MALLPIGPSPGSIRMLTAAATVCGFLAACAPAQASGREGLAQPERALRHPGIGDHPSDQAPVPAAAPRLKAPARKQSAPESRPAEPASSPDDEEEVSPGDDPASCEGCELAGFSLGGTLWGLFAVSRRRGVPRAVIRGLQPR